MSNKTLTIKSNVHVAGVFFPGKTYEVEDHEYIRNLARYGNVEIIGGDDNVKDQQLTLESEVGETDEVE